MLRVLIVDFDIAAASGLQRLLRRAGFSTETAYSGEEALKILTTFAPRIVIADFFTRGMHGSQLLTQIRNIAPKAIRVLMSASMSFGSAFTLDPTLALDTIDFFFEKPWDNKKLVSDLLHLHTRGSPGGAEHDQPGESAPVEPKRYLSELQVGDRLLVTGGRFQGASVTVKFSSLPDIYCVTELRGGRIEQFIPLRHLSVLDPAPSPPASPPLAHQEPQVLQSRPEVPREPVPDARIELNQPAPDAQPTEFESRPGPLKDILRLYQDSDRLEKDVLDPAPSPPAFPPLAHQDSPASLLDPQVLQSRLQALCEVVPNARIELNEPATDAQPAEFESRPGLPVDADTSSRSVEISLAPLKDILRRYQNPDRLEKDVLDPVPSPPAFPPLAHQDSLASLLDPRALQSRLQVLREAAPDARIELNEPATDAQLAEFESQLGLPVPETFRLLYRTFNGCEHDADTSSRSQIYLGISLVPLEDILRLHQKWTRLEKEAFSQRFRPGEYWNAGWIPFLEMEGWGLGVIDTVGCFGGPPGQIIQFNYKSGAERDITYASFDAWLLLLIEQLERATFFQERHAPSPRFRLPLSELAEHLNPGHPRRVVLEPVIPPAHSS